MAALDFIYTRIMLIHFKSFINTIKKSQCNKAQNQLEFTTNLTQSTTELCALFSLLVKKKKAQNTFIHTIHAILTVNKAHILVDCYVANAQCYPSLLLKL